MASDRKHHAKFRQDISNFYHRRLVPLKLEGLPINTGGGAKPIDWKGFNSQK